MTLLRVESVAKHFGGVYAVRDCSVTVQSGEIVGLIGPNGAGKSTLFNIIAGSIGSDRGRIAFDDSDVTAWPADKIARAGMVRTYQVPRPFGEMPVIENLLVAAPNQLGDSFLNVWLRGTAIREQENRQTAKAWEVLNFLRLDELANNPAGSLSGGQQKLLELARALMTEPTMLLLDEPVAGVNPSLAEQISEEIRALRERGMTFLIVEHKMDFIMSLADRLFVMAEGRILAQGTPAEIRRNAKVLDAYLGVA